MFIFFKFSETDIMLTKVQRNMIQTVHAYKEKKKSSGIANLRGPHFSWLFVCISTVYTLKYERLIQKNRIVKGYIVTGPMVTVPSFTASYMERVSLGLENRITFPPLNMIFSTSPLLCINWALFFSLLLPFLHIFCTFNTNFPFIFLLASFFFQIFTFFLYPKKKT
jgi:hypothetical protein